MPFTDNRAGERRAFNRASAIGLWATHAGKRCKKARLPSTPASALQESAGQSARHYEAIRPIAILTPFSGMSCPEGSRRIRFSTWPCCFGLLGRWAWGIKGMLAECIWGDSLRQKRKVPRCQLILIGALRRLCMAGTIRSSLVAARRARRPALARRAKAIACSLWKKVSCLAAQLRLRW